MIGHRTFILAGALSAIMTAAAAAAEPETVFFKSADDAPRSSAIYSSRKQPGLTAPSSCCMAAVGPIRSTTTRIARWCRDPWPRPASRHAVERHQMWGSLGGARLSRAAARIVLGRAARRMVLAASPMTTPSATTSTRRPFGRSMPRARSAFLCSRDDVDRQPDLPAGLVERRHDDIERDDPAGRADRGLSAPRSPSTPAAAARRCLRLLSRPQPGERQSAARGPRACRIITFNVVLPPVQASLANPVGDDVVAAAAERRARPRRRAADVRARRRSA